MPTALSIPYVGASVAVAIGLLVFSPCLLIPFTRNLLAQLALTLSGYFRPRPDPAMEIVLRTAFAEFDKELSTILGDRITPGHRRLCEPPA